MSDDSGPAARSIEIRSFRRVFDLERRIYRVDHLRLNPSGVPVRGVVYVAFVMVACLLLARLPLMGAPLRLLPWWLVDVGMPSALGSLAAMLHIDGRPFHHFALSVALLAARPRQQVALLPRRGLDGRWLAGSLLMLPDGSPPSHGRVRYRGPGVVRVGANVTLHAPDQMRAGAKVALLGPRRPARGRLVATVMPRRRAGVRRGGTRFVLLERGAELTVRRG